MPIPDETELTAAMAEMRAAVIVRLAHARALWVDKNRIRALIRTKSDRDVWMAILEANSGLRGTMRRLIWNFLRRRRAGRSR